MTSQFFLLCKFVVSVSIIGLLPACKPSHSILTTAEKSETHISSDNNLVTSYSENTVSDSRSSDEIIFKGKNNLFEIIQKNSRYFDQSHDVIVIKGDNTIIRLINTNVLDVSSGNMDTLVIVGNNEKYVIDVSNTIRTTRDEVRTDIVHFQEEPFDGSLFKEDVLQDDTPVRFDYFDSLVTVQYAYSYFLDKLATGEPTYFHELAEMYLYGLGVKQSSPKAIGLYEYAAAKNYLPSLMKLGDIFTGKFSVRRDDLKSLYYYKRCQQLGDSYCDDQIRKLLHK